MHLCPTAHDTRRKIIASGRLGSSARRDDLRDAKHRHIEDCGSGAVVRHLPIRRKYQKQTGKAPVLDRKWR